MLLGLAATTGASLCGGVLYRCRGGFIGNGSTTLARILWWAAPTGILLFALTYAASGELLYALRIGLGAGLASYLGLLVPHGFAQDKTGKAEFIGMTGVAFLRLLLILPVAPCWIGGVLPHLLYLPLFAPLQGVAYAIGWHGLDGLELVKWRPKNPQADDGSGYDHFAISGSEWGEALTGAFIWAALCGLSWPWG